ncbi:MAG: hypothetical protein ACQETQ_03970 [Spirochaetota bacterium]
MPNTTTNVISAALEVKRQYQTLMNNVILRNKAQNTSLSSSQWRDMDRLLLLDEDAEDGSIDVYETYVSIEAMQEFVRLLMTEVRSELRAELSNPRSHVSRENRIALQMTLANFDDNVRRLVDKLAELYVAVAELDEARSGSRQPVRAQFPELTDPASWLTDPS